MKDKLHLARPFLGDVVVRPYVPGEVVPSSHDVVPLPVWWWFADESREWPGGHVRRRLPSVSVHRLLPAAWGLEGGQFLSRAYGVELVDDVDVVGRGRFSVDPYGDHQSLVVSALVAQPVDERRDRRACWSIRSGVGEQVLEIGSYGR